MNNSSHHYHRLTGYDRHHMSPHRLDWAGQPQLDKHYPDLPIVNLPEPAKLPKAGLWDVLTGKIKPGLEDAPDLQQISRALYLANGLTGRSRQGKGYFYFRSPPSAGALYPNELYLAWFNPNDELEAGIYYYDTYQRRLLCLRRTNCRAFFPETDKHTCGLFLMTGIFFRSAWKYRKRAFRYVLLDGGHLLESTRLALTAAGRKSVLAYDFNDDQYNRLLGLDTDREVCLAAITINGPEAVGVSSRSEMPELSPAIAEASRVSPRETVYDEITETYRAGKSIPTSAAKPPRLDPGDLGLSVNTWKSIKPLAAENDDPVRLNYAESVLRRRSKRNFVPEPVSEAQLLSLLGMIRRAYLASGQASPDASKTVQTGFLSWGVDNIKPGFYLLDPSTGDIGNVHEMDLIPQMTSACLDQAWLKNAALHFLFMTNLAKLDEDMGARGYRYTMMTAGRLGHILYLAATSMRLGCCGIGAFYDREAEQLLGLNRDATLLYLVAVGQTR